MFGYVVASAENLPKERQKRFHEFYCGLCKKLRRRHGLIGGLTLSYDMSFLGLLLNALYEPGEYRGEERCPTHPMKRHYYVDSPVLDYCADMNVILAYYKCRDNWSDEKNLASAAEAKLLEAAYARASDAWPEQCAAIEDWLHEIHRIESNDIEAIDPPVNATGRMLGRLYQYRRDDIWGKSLYAIGDGLGRFVYLMDAYDDLPHDLKHRQYNPLKSLCQRENFEDICRDALMMAVADATREFELLPIVLDADVLRNVLYSGIWSKYVLIRKRRDPKKKEKENAGSL